MVTKNLHYLLPSMIANFDCQQLLPKQWLPNILATMMIYMIAKSIANSDH